ncbi:MAG: hypothetical protein FWG25_10440 [Promicromonosporaceae bacterium]|nr:hypothetical protein [Promicromonosporaceae bacterium]
MVSAYCVPGDSHYCRLTDEECNRRFREQPQDVMAAFDPPPAERWSVTTWMNPNGTPGSGVRCGYCGFVAVADPVTLHEQICQSFGNQSLIFGGQHYDV